MDWVPRIAAIKQDLKQLAKDVELLEHELKAQFPVSMQASIDRYVELTDDEV